MCKIVFFLNEHFMARCTSGLYQHIFGHHFFGHYYCLKTLHLTLRKCTGSSHRCGRTNQVSTQPTASLQRAAHTQCARVTSETTRNTETKRQKKKMFFLPSSADFILAGRVLRNGSPRSAPKLNLGLTLRQKVSCIQQAMRATSREAFTLKKKNNNN